MGKRGPRPTPTEIKRARGSQRARYDNPNEPKAKRVRPRAPTHLSPKAKKRWPALVALLDAMRILQEADLGCCERYVETWVQWRDAVDFLTQKGSVYPVKKWNPNANDGQGGFEIVGFREFPQFRIAARCAGILLELERDLGLTPAARTRIAAEKEPTRSVGRPPGSRADHATAAPSGPRLLVS